MLATDDISPYCQRANIITSTTNILSHANLECMKSGLGPTTCGRLIGGLWERGGGGENGQFNIIARPVYDD